MFSPEFIPNQSTLDFSVYNLDPSLHANRVARAFSSTTSGDDQSWTGRGFLSWLLAETDQGSTLIRGRLVREYEFSSAAFLDGGGLEGLMAAAVRCEDTDGKGWGLEVYLSLKEVNPDSKGEFSGRREFEDMLARGKPLVSTTPRSKTKHPDPRPAVRANDSTSSPVPTLHHGPSNSVVTIRAPQPQTFAHPSSASLRHGSVGTLPPSSISMASSSSNHAIPSRPSSADLRQPPAPSPLALRHTTPPPAPRRQSPPPSTPSRATLHALLRSEGKMSPGLAQTLASNPMLLRLLKAVPISAGPLSTLAASKPSPGVETPMTSSTSTPRINAPTTEGCGNCGTMQSEVWRTKSMKDGSKKKVCNGELSFT